MIATLMNSILTTINPKRKFLRRGGAAAPARKVMASTILIATPITSQPIPNPHTWYPEEEGELEVLQVGLRKVIKVELWDAIQIIIEV